MSVMANKNISTIITVLYIIIQTSIAIFVSVVGAIHVKRCINKSKLNSQIPKGNVVQSIQIHTHRVNNAGTQNNKDKGFGELWIKTVWKMRAVYAGLCVHSFDVLTDVLIILEWFKQENIQGDHIDPQLM
eukprot:13401_1